MQINFTPTPINAAFKIKPTFMSSPKLTGSLTRWDDEFQPQINIFTPNLSKDDCRKIIDFTEAEYPNASGITAEFYNLGDIGVKKQKEQMLFTRECDALDYLDNYGLTSIPKVKGKFYYKGNYFLLMDVMKGKSPKIENNIKFNPKNISSLMDTFFQMDKALFFDYDLHSGNVLLDGDNANIIDFGSYDVVNNYGGLNNLEGNNSFSIKYDIKKTPEDRFINFFKGIVYSENHFEKRAYEWNNVDNYDFPLRSNLVNFEYRCLSDYMKKYETINPEEAKKFYIEYLKQKADYGMKRIEAYTHFLEKLQNTPEGEILNRGLRNEQATVNVLKNPDDIIIEIEKNKMDLKAMSFESCRSETCDKSLHKKKYDIYERLMKNLRTIIKNPANKDLFDYATCQYQIYDSNFYYFF